MYGSLSFYNDRRESVRRIVSRGALVIAFAGAMSACSFKPDDSETPDAADPSTDPSVVAFSKTLFPLLDENCVACHTDSGPGVPKFAEGQITVAHDALIDNGLVDFDDAPGSFIVQKVGGGHFCWSGSCVDDAAQIAAAIQDWSNELDEHTQSPGIAAFSETVYPLAVENCSPCHDGSQAVVVGFANPDLQSAYDEIVNKSKVDLAEPENSRVVIRLAGGHVCWSDCASDAATMELAVLTWSNLVGNNISDPNDPPPGPNTQPIAVSDSVFTNFETSVATANVLANDVDLDGDALTVLSYDSISARSGVDNVQDNGNGSFTYTPPANFTGLDDFTYIASDGRGGAAIGTVFIAVEGNPVLRHDDRFLQFINRTAPLFQESEQTATAYYDAIDRFGERDTLAGFLDHNGFTVNNDTTNIISDAFAVYQNDMDLGFGRRMYIRTEPTTGVIASYVENYPDLQSAADQVGLIATVAMEYRAAVGTNPANPDNFITTFYVYGADGRRALGADLDGQGFKFVPGVCNTCHGGRPKAVLFDNVYPDAGDTGARFLAWDLDTYVFNPVETSPFSRQSQEALFRVMNSTVLNTRPTAAQRELIEGWYNVAEGTNPLPIGSTFDGSFIPQGWLPAGGAPDDAAALYSQVVAPYCRACHVVRGDDPLQDSIHFRNHSDFAFYNKRIDELVFDQSVMPMALRTFDRFWTDSPQTALTLAEHIGSTRLLEDGSVLLPGRPIANAGPFRRAPLGSIELNANGSLFEGGVNAFNWNLASIPDGSQAQLIGATTRNPSFVADTAGDYIAQLIVNDGIAATAPSPPSEVVIRVENNLQPVSLIDDIVPLLTDCSDACHGVGSRLNLPDFSDVPELHDRLLDFIDLDDPTHSRLLTQPSGQTAHGGGIRPGFESTIGLNYELLLRWLVEGTRKN